jgi:hypothetical protein
VLKKFYIVLFLFFYTSLFANSDIKIIQSSQTSLIVEYIPTYRSITDINIDLGTFKEIDLAGGIINSAKEISLPQIPFREINIGVPSEFGNTIQVLQSDYSIIPGKIIPIPAYIKDDFSFKRIYSISEEYDNNTETDLVVFGSYGEVRELAVQTIKIYPVQFNASSQSVKLYNKIIFRINFSLPSGERIKISDKKLKSIVVNFNEAVNWGLKNKAEKSLNKVSSNDGLSSGVWYKFETSSEGIYKIDYNSLSSYGINPDNVDPRTIKIYNGGGYQLSENLSDPRPEDITEIAISVIGESDGRFDLADYILFYGRPPNFWHFNSSQEKLVRNKHYYDESNFYFITSGGTDGKRIQTKASLNSANTFKQSSTIQGLFYEDDRLNLFKSGRLYIGDEFSVNNNGRTYINSLNNRVSGSTVNYTFQFVNYSERNIVLEARENNNVFFSASLSGAPWQYELARLNTVSGSFNGNIPDNRSVLNLNFKTNNTSDLGYLDYYEIQWQAQLRAVDDYLIIFSYDTTAVIEYEISDFTNSGMHAFDVTEFENVKQIDNVFISGGQLKFQVDETENNIRKYLVCTPAKYLTPDNPVQIDNSNLRSNLMGAQLLIITNKIFREQAERLKNYRENDSPNPLSTRVIFIDDIFNEFSSGMLDPTGIRDFLTFAYENYSPSPFYVLFFGDGNYDYLNREGYSNNFIPTYQTLNSLHYIDSFPTDDYFADAVGSNRIDFAHGRISVRSPEEADLIIDKIIEYETESEKGLWRNTMTLIADDGPAETGVDDRGRHTVQSERLSNYYIPKYFNQNKIYLAAYPTVFTGLGRRKPAVNTEIISAVNNGTLILNFIGHGNRKTWAHERVFERETTIPQFNNDKYFFLTAATCNFGEYDDPGVQSATEELLLLSGKGSIGGFSASRPVYSDQNARLNDSLFSNLFIKKDSVNKPLRVGHAFFNAKQSSLGSDANSKKFHIFGDPTLKLNEPDLPVSIDSINNQALNLDVQIKALGQVDLDGHVLNRDGSLSNFNGEGIISVFDAERVVDLKEINDTPERRKMILQGGVIFRGRVSVTNGNFSANFVVPKDISYDSTNGKVVAYVFNDEYDGIGFSDKIIVGGTDTNTTDDGNGPDIEIFYDDIDYENSYLVNPDFTLFVRLEDETGLNTTGTGVGHKLEAVINGDEQNKIDFSNYFIGDLDTGGKAGTIKYKFNSLAEGDYNLKVKAWDIFNNPSNEESNFTVVTNNNLVLRDVVNYPNPFSSSTTFTFQHNLSNPVNVKVKVYTVAGRLIRDIEKLNIIEKFVRIGWDGRDEDGSIIANGTYLYKVSVETIDGSYKENVLGKMAVIR